MEGSWFFGTVLRTSKGPTSVIYVFPPSGSPDTPDGLFDPTTCTMPPTAYCNHSDSLVPLLKEHHEI